MRGQIWVTRKKDERFCPDCTIKTKASGRTSVMVWGGIWYGGATDLVWFRPTTKLNSRNVESTSITASDYIDQVLEPHLEPAYRGLKELELEPIVMEDNASIHTAKEARDWKESAGMIVMKWPPSSPDLNPEENMWGAMKSRIRHQPDIIDTRTSMWSTASAEWERLRATTHFDKWIESMDARMEEVIKMDGYATRF